MSLTVEQLYKRYKDNQVIQNFDFQISPGEIVILLGSSGTGKTTFMRLINNLERADRGTIQIDGNYLCKDNGKKAIYEKSHQQRIYQNSLGMVFQDYQLFPNFTVLENLLEAPLAQELDSKENLTKRALTLLSEMEIEEKANVYPSTLSGGQKQRVAIARALMLEPSVLCFDEPTSALDVDSANRVGALIRQLSENGKAILIVTHDRAFGKEYGTRIISSESFINQA